MERHHPTQRFACRISDRRRLLAAKGFCRKDKCVVVRSRTITSFPRTTIHRCPREVKLLRDRDVPGAGFAAHKQRVDHHITLPGRPTYPALLREGRCEILMLYRSAIAMVGGRSEAFDCDETAWSSKCATSRSRHSVTTSSLHRHWFNDSSAKRSRSPCHLYSSGLDRSCFQRVRGFAGSKNWMSSIG